MFLLATHQKASEYHDFGKLSQAFQNYIMNPQKAAKTRHTLKGALYYLLQEKLLIRQESFSIFFSILRHHGDLPDVNDYVLRNLGDMDGLEETVKEIHLICQQVSIPLESEQEANDVIELFDTETFTDDHYLNGLETYFETKEVFSRLIFADKFEAIFKDVFSHNQEFNPTIHIEKLHNLIAGKSNPMSDIRNQAREEIISNYKSNSQKQIFLIEAPTGIGKTFTALHLALEIAKDKGKKRIINALPMTSIIDQTHEQYKEIINEKYLLKFHYLTNAKSYDEQDQESGQAGAENEERLVRQKNDYVASSWSGDSVIVTTFNQLFYAIFSNKNRDLIKLWTLQDSVIILDEIQAIPRILLKDVAYVIEFLSQRFNIDFILMSATIPAIKNFFHHRSMAELLDNRYYEMSFNNRYGLAFNPDISDIERLADEIVVACGKYNSVVCVVNTKKVALSLYEKLEQQLEEDRIFLLSTNHIPLHRKAIIGTIKNRLDNGIKTVLVSTQVIEAGVDLDFDFGFREFAPFSSIIQTAGRINREGTKSAAGLIVTNRIGPSPYDEKDLLFSEVTELLGKSPELRENGILPVLKEYFQIAIQKTSKDFQLLEEMERLNFETVFKRFNDRFMKTIPNQLPVFIEIEDGIYDEFAARQEQVINRLKSAKTLAAKMDIRIQLKEIQKEVSGYVINVNASDARNELNAFYDSNEMKWCPNHDVNRDIGQSKYTDKKGWLNNDDGSCFF